MKNVKSFAFYLSILLPIPKVSANTLYNALDWAFPFNICLIPCSRVMIKGASWGLGTAKATAVA